MLMSLLFFFKKKNIDVDFLRNPKVTRCGNMTVCLDKSVHCGILFFSVSSAERILIGAQ